MAGTDVPVKGEGNWGRYHIDGSEPWALGAGSAVDGIKFSSGDIQNTKMPMMLTGSV
jgi:hypothetical protein